MDFKWKQNNQNGVSIYNREYIGNGKYYMRGVASGIKVGDNVIYRNVCLECEEILSLKDSEGEFKKPEMAKDSLYEGHFIDNSFEDDSYYVNLHNIGWKQKN